MAQIPESVIQEILDKADIESVVGKYVSFIKRTGSNYFGLCPFHSEKTPSFSVSLTKGIYHCFGCQKGGNAIKFIQEIEKLSYPEAIRFLGNQYGVEVPDTYDGKNNDFVKEQKARVRKLLTETGLFYFQCLSRPDAAACKEYIKKRNLDKETVRKFGIGYAPEGWDTLYQHLKSKGYTDEEMRNSGLFTVSKKTGKLIDLFRGRMMFPIFDSFGKLIAFGGRTLGSDMPKYVNSPDSLVYKKQEHLYALNFAKKSRINQLIIVEGYMDAIAMHQAGVENAVASLGTAFTDSQLRLVSKYADEVVFFFDADGAGQKAAIRAIKMMLKYLKKMTGLKIRIKIACVPDGKDPDEYIRVNGSEKFKEVVKQAKDVDDYLAMRAYNDNYTDENGLDTYQYQEDIIEYGAWVYDEIKRQKMAAAAALNLSCSYEIVLTRMQDYEVKLNKEQANMDERNSRKSNEADLNERIALNQEVTEENTSASQEIVTNAPGYDLAYRQELELLVYAVRLKENLCNPNMVSQEDVLRPGDFKGQNMKSIIEFFLKNFDASMGVKESVLIGELSRYVFNGMPAEEVYLSMDSSLPEIRDVSILRDKYLSTLYRLRISYLNKYQKRLINALSTAPYEKREALNNQLKKVIAMREKLIEKESKL